MKAAACALALIFLLDDPVGCDKPQAKPVIEAKHYPPIHRFENVTSTGQLGVALDTVTGQWCKTWEWVYRGNAQSLSGGLDTLPTCLSLYRQVPQTDTDPFKQFGGTANPQ